MIKLIGEQKDSGIRGWWNNGTLSIETEMDRKQILDFFQEEYDPTPIISPWAGGSGFYERDSRDGMDKIMKTTSKRFQLYRDTISAVRNFPELNSKGETLREVIETLESKQKKSNAVENAKKALDELHSILENPLNMPIEDIEARIKLSNVNMNNTIKQLRKAKTEFNKLKRDEAKTQIINSCRDKLHLRALEWIDASVVVNAEDRLKFPPLLGSGGNEGRLEYSRNYMDNLALMLLEGNSDQLSRDLLVNAIFGEDTENLVVSHIGKFDPGRSGGYNQGNKIENKDFLINPWDFILLMEGVLLWSSSIGKRYDLSSRNLQTPFTASASPVGYSSSLDSDRKDSSEIWAPVWQNPIGISELKAFFREGRTTINGRKARTGLEFTEAVSSLGVDRGIKEFVRYNMVKRRGESYIALPTGHIAVQMNHNIDLINELDPILSRLDSFLRKFDDLPSSYVSARRNVDQAIYNLSTQGNNDNVQALLRSLGQIECLIAKRNHNSDPKIGPLTGLSERWLSAADDGSVEYRIAVALASIRGTGGVGSIRANLEGVNPLNESKWDDGNGQNAWRGNTFSERLSNVLYRRFIDADRLGCKNNPTWGVIGLSGEDIAHFIEGVLDENRIQDILFGLMFVRWSGDKSTQYVRELNNRWSKPVTFRVIHRSWAFLKLLFLPQDIAVGTEKVKIRPEKKVIQLLSSGRINEATKMAEARLFASGLITFKASFADTIDGTKMAAALLIPIRRTADLTKLVLNEKQRRI